MNPAANSSDEDDEDDEQVDPDGGASNLTAARPSTFPSFLPASLPSTALPSALPSSFLSEEAYLFRPGSNNWVVSGQHTVTRKKPLLSNDMHPTPDAEPLVRRAPGGEIGQLDVAGVTLPGDPIRDRRPQPAHWLGFRTSGRPWKTISLRN